MKQLRLPYPRESSSRSSAGSAVSSRSLAWIGLGVVILAGAACYALSFAPPVTGSDDAVYLVTAQAMATGRGYCRLNLVGCPPETYYPPGFPAVLAAFLPWLPAWPLNIPYLALLPALFALLSLPVIYLLMQDQIANRLLALLITGAVAVNYVATWYTDILMSETLYLLLSMAALLFLAWADAKDKPWPWYGVAGLLIGATAMVRSVGLTLLAAAVISHLLRRQGRRAGLILLVAGLVLAPSYLRAFSVMGAEEWQAYRGVFINSYVDTLMQRHWQDTTLGRASLADFGPRLATNITGHATHSLPLLLLPTVLGQRLQETLVAHRLEWSLPLTYGLLAGFTVTGLILRLQERIRLVDLYVILYMGMILLPGWFTFRNLVPILPFIYLYVVVALLAVGGILNRRLAWPVVALPVAFLVLSMSSNLLSQARGNFRAGATYRSSGEAYVEERPSFLEACQWIRSHTEPEDRVVYRSSEKMYLCSQRQAPAALSTFPVSLDGRDHDGVIAAVRQEADYVVVTTTDFDPPLTDGEPVDFQSTYFLNPVLASDSGHFQLAYETAGEPVIQIYRVLRQGP